MYDIIYRNLEDNSCDVCEGKLTTHNREPIFSPFGSIIGWKCSYCNSLYDLQNELMLIGDFHSPIRGDA